MNEEKEIKITGSRQFASGARRDPNTSKGRYDLLSPLFLRRLALHTQKGGQARGDRNWEVGMPMDVVLDSALRHLNNFLEGDRSEDHLAAAAWNVMNLIHTEEQIERGNLDKSLAAGLPDYTAKKLTMGTGDDIVKLVKQYCEGLGLDPYEYIREDIFVDRIKHEDVYPEVYVDENDEDPRKVYPVNRVDPYYNPEGTGNPLTALERACCNCVHKSPTNGPVPMSDRCIECNRLSNWKGELT